MPPRNTRLSAYYNLPPSSPKSSPPSLPKTRDEALSHAENLTRTLPLQDLLNHATTQKTRSETLSKQLHTATLSHYQHLQSALKTAEHVQSLCKSLHPSTETISDAITLSKAINQGLAETRALVTSLEAARKVEQLLKAADILINQFPKLAEQLPLCTDPDNLRADIHISSHRYAAIRPAVSKLATIDKSLKSTVESLDRSAKKLSEALTAEQTVLSRGDIANIRLTLQDDRTSVEHDYVTSIVDDVLHKQVSEKALSGTPVDKAVTRVNFFVDHVFGTLMDDVQVYKSLFGDCLWVSEVVHDALAEVREGIHDVIDGVAGVRKLRHALTRLSDLGGVGRFAAEGVEDVVRQTAFSEASEQVRKLVNNVESMEKKEAVERVKELREKVVSLFGWDQQKVELFISNVVTQSKDVREAAAGAGICQLLVNEGWQLAGVRDMCVELTVEEVLQQFRRDLKGNDEFVESVRYIDTLRKRLGVVGLVDDDLGDGFGNRIRKGVIEIVREKGLNLEEAERVRGIVERVKALNMNVLNSVIEERWFE